MKQLYLVFSFPREYIARLWFLSGFMASKIVYRSIWWNHWLWLSVKVQLYFVFKVAIQPLYYVLKYSLSFLSLEHRTLSIEWIIQNSNLITFS